MDSNIRIKHLAVLAASVLNFILAFIWYGPLFGDLWIKGAEISNPSAPSLWATIISFIVGLIFCYGIAFILKWTKKTGVKNGIKIGVFVSFVFLLQVVIGPWLFSGRFLLFAVNMPYFMLSAIFAGAIVGNWQKSS